MSEGTVATIFVSDQTLTPTALPLNWTTLIPFFLPKPLPKMMTSLIGLPSAGDIELIMGLPEPPHPAARIKITNRPTITRKRNANRLLIKPPPALPEQRFRLQKSSRAQPPPFYTGLSKSTMPLGPFDLYSVVAVLHHCE